MSQQEWQEGLTITLTVREGDRTNALYSLGSIEQSGPDMIVVWKDGETTAYDPEKLRRFAAAEGLELVSLKDGNDLMPVAERNDGWYGKLIAAQVDFKYVRI